MGREDSADRVLVVGEPGRDLRRESLARQRRRDDARVSDADLDGALAATGERLKLVGRGLDERGLGFSG